MKRVSAKDAKNGFGKLIDTALAEPVIIEKHGRPVIVVLSFEEFQRMSDPFDPSGPEAPQLLSEQNK